MYLDAVQLTRKLPERVAYFRFSDTRSVNGRLLTTRSITFPGSNVRFNIQYFPEARHGGSIGTFGICNIGGDIMEDLSNRYETPEGGRDSGELRRVEVFAGYNSPDGNLDSAHGVAKIFDGSILKTSVSSAPPDVWFNFESRTNPELYLGSIEQTLQGGDRNLTFRQICQAVADYCDISLNYQATREFSVNTFTVSGTRINALRHLSKVAPALFSIKVVKDTLVVFDRGSADIILPKFVETWKISEQSGLTGVPQFTPFGAVITVLLNVQIHPNDIVDLKSVLMPYWNGRYYVANMTHFGELRGKDFCTKLELIRTDKIW